MPKSHQMTSKVSIIYLQKEAYKFHQSFYAKLSILYEEAMPSFYTKTDKPTTLIRTGNEWEPMDLTESRIPICLQAWNAISIKKSSSHKWDGEVASTLARRPPFPSWKLHHPMIKLQLI